MFWVKSTNHFKEPKGNWSSHDSVVVSDCAAAGLGETVFEDNASVEVQSSGVAHLGIARRRENRMKAKINSMIRGFELRLHVATVRLTRYAWKAALVFNPFMR